jgi:hypothetical protein
MCGSVARDPRIAHAHSVWSDAIAEAVAVFVEEECGACVQVHHRAAIGLEAAVDV